MYKPKTLVYLDPEMHLAYMGGLVDGEGYISLVPVRNKTQEKKDFYLVPTVKVASTYLDVLDYIKEEHGGHISKLRVINKRCKPARSWELRNRKLVYKFLHSIYPHLRIKKEQAKIVLRFICEIETDKNKRGMQNKMPQSKRDEYYKLIRKLNKRGPATTE